MSQVNILVVDDERDILQIIGQFMKRSGFQADLAETVDRAMELMEENAYDIMLTDKNMPDADGRMEGGMTLLRHARADHPDMEVIMITGHATVDTAVEAMKLGAFDYLMKPISLMDLKEKIDRLLDYRRFVNSEDTLNIYRLLHQQILQTLENRDDLPEEKLDQMLRTLGGRIDQVFGLQRHYEVIIQNQADALERIETYATHLQEALPEGSPYGELAEKILQESHKRV